MTIYKSTEISLMIKIKHLFSTSIHDLNFKILKKQYIKEKWQISKNVQTLCAEITAY